MAVLISRMEGEVISRPRLVFWANTLYSSLDIFGGSLVKFDELVAKSLSVVESVGLAEE